MSERLEKKRPDPAGTAQTDFRISDDGYTAALFIPEEMVPFPSAKQVHLAIEKAGINYGLDDNALARLIKEQIKGKQVVFARGKLPVEGGISKLIWHDNSAAEAQPIDVTEEFIDPDKKLYLFMNVEKGQEILSKLPAPEGEAGINVFGKTMTMPGNDLPMPEGEGTCLSKDGLFLLAGKPGVAVRAGDKIVVNDVHRIDGSIGTQTGDIKIDGSVYIEKDVCSGFRVEAIGDIFIGGSIEGAEVYSRAGSVIVRNGIFGQGKAKVLAGRKVIAGFIQDATIGAKFDVEAQRYIINSAVAAGRYINAVTNEGIVRGGTLLAEKRIDVRTAGSDGRITTDLKVGYSAPVSASRVRYQLRSDQRNNRLELAYVQKRLAFLNLLKGRMGRLTDDKEEQLAELERKERILRNQHRNHGTRDEELQKQAAELENVKPEAETIRIHDTIYAGVSVAIGSVSLDIDRERHNVIFFRVGDRLAFGPLRQALENKS